MRAWTIRHPQRIVEAGPELEGVGGGERGARREVRLKGGQGLGAQFAIYSNASFSCLVSDGRGGLADEPLEARFLIKGIWAASADAMVDISCD